MTRETDTISNSPNPLPGCPAGVATINANGIISSVNQSLTEMLGVSEDTLRGIHYSAIPDSNLGALFSGQPTVTLLGRDGREQILAHTEAADGAGSIHYFLDQTEFFTLQQEKERLQREITQLQLIDSSTGLYTERAIMLILEPQVSLCRRYENPLAIMCLAIDFGSDIIPDGVVDEKILRISHLLKDQMRWADMIGRIHQDQVVLVLPETGMEAAQLLADKIQGILTGLEDIQQVDIGITGWKKSDSATRLLNRAREALKQAQSVAESTITTL